MNYSAIIKKKKMYGKLKNIFQKELQTIEDNGILKKKNYYSTRQRLQFQQEKLF
jgi:hypothetical protein